MSVRRAPANAVPHVAQLQKELGDLKATALATNATDGAHLASAQASANAPSFDQLSGVEQSAASLGVHPDVRLSDSKTFIALCFALLKLTHVFLCRILAELETHQVAQHTGNMNTCLVS